MGNSKPSLPVSYADLEALPPQFVGEIVAGDLYTSPRPAILHTYAASQLGFELLSRYGSNASPGGWFILDEPELHLLGNVLVPDLAGWRKERMPRLENLSHFTLAPDWVCEILSSGTMVLDRKKKLPIYAEAGIPHAWLIDPLVRTLEVYRLESGTYRLLETLSDNASVLSEPFVEAPFNLLSLWAP